MNNFHIKAKRLIRKVLRLPQSVLGSTKSRFKGLIKRVGERRFEILVKCHVGKIIKVGVDDLFWCQFKNKELVRYDMIVRYLAVENYYGLNDYGFRLYQKMQDDRVRKGYSEEAVRKFQALIKSYDESGYDEESYIVVDKNLHLFDGSHRMALALFHGVKTISVLEVNSSRYIEYTIDWFIEKGFSDEEVNIIIKKAEELKYKTNDTMSCVIWAPATKLQDEIISGLGRFGSVESFKQYNYTPGVYENIVRAVYAIDDIEKWKIDKKLDYMRNRGDSLTAVELRMDDPLFRVKAATGLPLSTVGERAKKSLRGRAKPNIDNYFFDIVLHIADNHMQSEYMKKVFEPNIDLTELCDSLFGYRYAFTKTDAPYMPESFAKDIPVGKDIDVVCHPADFESITNCVKCFVDKLDNVYEVDIRAFANRKMFRINVYDHLIFLIDCFCKGEGLTDSFIEEAVTNRILTGGYFEMSPKYEILNRITCYIRKPNKEHHLDYIKDYTEDFDANLAEKLLDKDIYTKSKKLLANVLIF